MMVSLFNQENPDKLLYHYTSQAGLLGIIQSRQLWATNLLFLNDSTELNYALKLIQKNITALKPELPSSEHHFFDSMGEDFESINSSYAQSLDGIYICSFSENDNQLSQWRGYCPDAGGFSIGFDFRSSLHEVVKEQKFNLVKCVYDESSQELFVRKFLNEQLRNFHQEQDVFKLSSKAWNDFLTLAPVLKHPKFEEEREWRLVSEPMLFTGVNYRVGKSMLIPYVNINLDNKNEKAPDLKRALSCISEIWVGPTPHPELSKISLENMLRSEKIFPLDESAGRPVQKCDVRISGIPYRTW